MIHEIFPDLMDNQYRSCSPSEDSRMIFMKSREICIREKEGLLSWPLYGEVMAAAGRTVYLFSISGHEYFLAEHTGGELPGDMKWENWMALRDKKPVAEAFAAMTAMHLYTWYSSVQYCGRCGHKAEHDSRERMMRCPSCGNLMFPKISPAVVAAVTDGKGRILLTKYAGRANAQYALVAGFIEIGETAEECVKREVLEEVGLPVKNVKYYGSQPWGFVGNLMMGFTAELDGDADIVLDEQELSAGQWLTREEVPEIEDYSSLTREMIRRFRMGEL